MIDLIKELKQIKKKEYLAELKTIDRMASTYRRVKVFEMKLSAFFTGCTVTTSYLAYRPVVHLHLTEGYNIKDDVNMFIEKEEKFIDFLLDGAEMSSNWYQQSSLDFKIGPVAFAVYYSGGRCVRKQVGTKTVEQPIYEIECE